MARVSRRTFLSVVAAAVAGAGAIGVAAARSRVQRLAENAVDLVWSPSRELRRHFSYLDIDPAAIDQYVADHEVNIRRLSRFTPWPDEVYTRFLMSTDFFQNGANESRRITYVSFFHPYVTFCYNPLATFDDATS